MKPLVYLAGPILGTSYDGCTSWRDYVTNKLNIYGIVGLSPMREKEYLSNEVNISDSYDDKIMSSQRGIFARDSFDCRRCDAIFINLLEAERVSIGTVMEIAWGWAYHKPMVLVMEKEGNLHNHAMIREACPFVVSTLDEGIAVTMKLLLP